MSVPTISVGYPQFRYCPLCGSPHFEPHDQRARRCEACGFTFYENAAAAVAAVILNDKRELLVTRRAFEPARGTLDLPGGFVDPGERLEDAIVREVREETHLDVCPERWLFSTPDTYLFSGITIHTTDSFFLCSVLSKQAPTASDDAAALFWVPLSTLSPKDFGLPSISEGIQRLQDFLS